MFFYNEKIYDTPAPEVSLENIEAFDVTASFSDDESIARSEKDEPVGQSIFIVCVDDQPEFASLNRALSLKYMERLAKEVAMTTNEYGITPLINYKSEEEIDVIHTLDFILFSYNAIFKNIKLHETRYE